MIGGAQEGGSGAGGPARDRVPGSPWSAVTVGRMWATLPSLVTFLVTLTSTMVAVDLAYQIRTGEEILTTGALPHVDTFTFSVPGVPWLDQQWGAQVLLASGYRAGSWAGLVVLRAVLIGATYGFVYLACRARGAGPRTSCLLTFGGVVLGLRGLALRPQLFALPLVAATLWVLAGRRAHPRRLWWLPVFAVAMANLHGAFVLIPVIAALSVIEDLVERQPPWPTLAAGVLATAATLFNPFGLGAWRYAYRIATNPVIRDTISEWRPVSLTTIAGAAFAVSIVLLAVLVIRRGRPVDVPALIWLAVFAALAVPASRGLVLWGLVAPTVAARMLPPRKAPVRVLTRRWTIAVVTGTIVVALAVLPWWRDTSAGGMLSRAPQGLAAAVARDVPRGTHLLVWQPWGSWFEFATPEDPVFVDSRIELYPAAVWHENGDLWAARGAWSSLLARYDVGAIVTADENDTLAARLRGQPGWTLAYEDDEGSLFVRADLR